MDLSEYQILTIRRKAEQFEAKIKKFNLLLLSNSITKIHNFSNIIDQLQQLGIWAFQYPNRIFQAIEKGGQFCILIGFRPSRFHLGHITLAREVAWYVCHGAIPIFVVSGYEANLSLSLDDAKDKVSEFWNIVTSICDKEINTPYYVFSDDDCFELKVLIDKVEKSISVNKILQLYGWESNISVSALRIATMNAAIFLLPQSLFPKIPTLVLSDINQVTHAEIVKIVANKLNIEPPSFSYRILLQSLLGPDKRMSTKDERSVIYLDEQSNLISEKLFKCFSGGSKTIEEQVEKGGDPFICSFFKISSLLFTREKTSEMLYGCTSDHILCKECKLKYTELSVCNLSKIIKK